MLTLSFWKSQIKRQQIDPDLSHQQKREFFHYMICMASHKRKAIYKGKLFNDSLLTFKILYLKGFGDAYWFNFNPS